MQPVFIFLQTRFGFPENLHNISSGQIYDKQLGVQLSENRGRGPENRGSLVFPQRK